MIKCPFSCSAGGYTKVWVKKGIRYHDFYITSETTPYRVETLMVCRDGWVRKA